MPCLLSLIIHYLCLTAPAEKVPPKGKVVVVLVLVEVVELLVLVVEVLVEVVDVEVELMVVVVEVVVWLSV